RTPPMYRVSNALTPDRPSSRLARNSGRLFPMGHVSPTPVMTIRSRNFIAVYTRGCRVAGWRATDKWLGKGQDSAKPGETGEVGLVVLPLPEGEGNSACGKPLLRQILAWR